MYKRILIKLSGESLSNKEKSLAIDYEKVVKIAEEVKNLSAEGYEIGIVVGAGNFWRGASATKNGIPRTKADYIGMVGTLMNALAIEGVFQKMGIQTLTMSAINIDKKVAQQYVSELADKSLKSKKVVIFGGGTGRPYFTTDTTAILVASELNVDIVLLAKNNTPGVFDKDPNKFPDAKHYDKISYDVIIQNNLEFMDITATTMAKENNLKLIVFNINDKNSISNAIIGKIKHTKVGF